MKYRHLWWRPHDRRSNQATAFVWRRLSVCAVALGVNANKDGVVEYVRSGSVAQKVGLVEGMKILAVNGNFVQGDEYIFEREILSRQPGDRVQIEYLDKNGEKIFKEVILEKTSD